jgi:mannosyltransferase OCH1-like enzyme
MSYGLIPQVVIQTWEDRLFGKSHRMELIKFRALNPELRFEIWDSEKRLTYMRITWGHHKIFKIYQNTLFGPMKADIFRYCIMYERGGFYFDISMGCTIPLRTLYGPDTKAVITFEPHTSLIACDKSIAPHLLHPDKLVLQWGFGFTPEHPIPLQIIDNICAEYHRYKNKVFPYPKDAIRELTGPIMFTKSVWDAYAKGPLDNVVQAGIDFNGYGVFELKGSRVRYITMPKYGNVKNQPILLDQ